MEIPAESLWAAVGRSRDPLDDIALFSRNYEANGSCTRALGDERLPLAVVVVVVTLKKKRDAARITREPETHGGGAIVSR